MNLKGFGIWMNTLLGYVYNNIICLLTVVENQQINVSFQFSFRKSDIFKIKWHFWLYESHFSHVGKTKTEFPKPKLTSMIHSKSLILQQCERSELRLHFEHLQMYWNVWKCIDVLKCIKMYENVLKCIEMYRNENVARFARVVVNWDFWSES